MQMNISDVLELLNCTDIIHILNLLDDYTFYRITELVNIYKN